MPTYTAVVNGQHFPFEAANLDAAVAIQRRLGARVSEHPFTAPTGLQVPRDGGTPEGDYANNVQRWLDEAVTARERSERPAAEKIADFTRAFTTGATLGAAPHIMAAADDIIPGGATGAQRLAFEREQSAAFRRERPILSNLTEMAGALPWGLAGAPVAGAPLIANVARGAGAGAAQGLAYGFNAADGSIGDRMRVASQVGAVGGALGGGIPLAGAALGPIANVAASTARTAAASIPRIGGAPQAQRAITGALRDSGTTPQALGAELARNPALAPLDVDTNLFALAQGVATRPGSARTIVTRSMLERQAEAPGRVTGAFDAAAGPTPNVLQLLNGYKQTANTNARAAFPAILDNAGPVNLQPVLQEIDRAINLGIDPVPGMLPRAVTPEQNALQAVRNTLTASGRDQVTNANVLHTLQSRLRVQADDLARSGKHAEAAAIRAVRQDIIAAIDEAAGGPPQGITPDDITPPGPYRAAQRQYADDMSIQRAFDRGGEILDNPQANETRPEYWADWWGDLSQPEQQAARLGARAAIDTRIKTTRQPTSAGAQTAGARITEVPFNLERMRIVFGDEEANALARLLTDEQRMAGNTSALLSGSQTAPRQAAMDATNVRGVGGAPMTLGTAAAGAGVATALQGNFATAAGLAAAGAAGAGATMLGRAFDKARNAELARILTARGKAGQQALVNRGTPRPSIFANAMNPVPIIDAGMTAARAVLPGLVRSQSAEAVSWQETPGQFPPLRY